MTPEWTPERLDEEGRRQGRAQAWIRKARAGEFKSDPYEQLRVEGGSRVYSIITALTVAFAYGNASEKALEFILGNKESGVAVLEVVQIPALVLLLVCVGSSVFSGAVLAPSKKRNSFVWSVKGLMGGPVTVFELRGLDELQIRGMEN